MNILVDPSEIEPEANPELLLKAFQQFSDASLQLEKAYQDLQDHTQKLDLELRDTNARLSRSLREQEAVTLHLRGILNTLRSGILVIDLEGVVEEINPCAQQLLEVVARKEHFSKMDLPKPVADFIHTCIDSIMPRIPREDVTIVNSEGEELDLELQFSLVRPETGGILSVLILINDMTHIHRLQSQAKRNARLAAMGEMAAELAHEIRNPLGSIKLFASLLEQDLEALPEKAQLVDQISQGVNVLENIVSNILSFSANVKPKREPLEVAPLLQDTRNLFEMELRKKDIQLEISCPQDSLRIHGDSHLLKQMLLNLSINAIKAMQPGGCLKLSARARDDYVEISVEDTGHGIPAAKLPKIFDPFYTTFQGGTGLGLSVVNQIADKHGGALEVKSKVNVGTTVYVSIPRLYQA